MRKNKISIKYFETPVGELVIGSYKERLCLCDWRYRRMRNSIDRRIAEALNADFFEEETDVIKTTKQQISEYLEGKRFEFNIPIEPIGSSFQQSVWEELMKIPFGKTETYLGLSKKLGNEKAIRAVASANGANAIAIIIPCHRVIGSDGELVGYAGGLNTKKKLLKLENRNVPEQLALFG